MITSRDAAKLLIPEVCIKEVVFKRRRSINDVNAYDLRECITYLIGCDLRYDEIVSTYQHYIFQQNITIRDAHFKYKRRVPGIVYVWQTYSRNHVSDICSEYAF